MAIYIVRCEKRSGRGMIEVYRTTSREKAHEAKALTEEGIGGGMCHVYRRKTRKTRSRK